MASDNPFAPFALGEGHGEKPKKQRPKITPIIPVPDSAPQCELEFKHYKYGIPNAGWSYHDAQNRIIAYAVRFDLPNNEKQIIPVCFCSVEWANGNIKHEWRSIGVPEPRPLFNLPELLANPSAPVIFTEGEKKAAIVRARFPGYIGTTTMGGAKAPHQTDFGPLAGRNIIAWPDNDEAGRDYADQVAALATKVSASVWVVAVPPGLPEGWDIADELPNGFQAEQMAEALRSATPWQPREAVPEPIPGLSYVSFGDFTMDRRGLYYVNRESPKSKPQWLSEPFEILAMTRDAENNSWGKRLRWRDPEGLIHEYTMLTRALISRTDELWAELLDGGLKIALSPFCRGQLADYLLEAAVQTRVRSVPRIGWHPINEISDLTPLTPELSGGVRRIPIEINDLTPLTPLTPENDRGEGGSWAFVLPDRTYGARDLVTLQTDKLIDPNYGISGTLDEWRKHVASKCEGNSRLVFAVSAAFAVPLLKIINEEGGGFHFVAESRKGKTTLLRVAGSVCGGNSDNAGGYMRSWRTTSNGLESTALAHCDMLLILDEFGELPDPKEAGIAAYMLANGYGKGRSTRTGGARSIAQWLLLFLSSGEQSLADKMAEIGQRTKGGQETRMADVPADAGMGFGVFEKLHDAGSAGVFAENLRQATQRYYGTAISAYLEKLVSLLNADPAQLRERLVTSRNDFMNANLPAGASEQVRSVCGRFAIVAAAGSLATEFDITGWPDDEAECNAAICFKAWLAKRGTAGDHDIETGIRQVKAYIEAHGSTRFEAAWENPKSVENIETTKAYDRDGVEHVTKWITERVEGARANRVGFRRRDDETGNWQYMIFPEQWRKEVAKGCPETLTKAMVDRGLLIPDNAGKTSISIYVPKQGTIRMYLLALSFISS